MSENCSHDCGSCSADCSSRSPQNMIEQPNKESRIDKVIGVVSGKGGVGKSMISSMLAVNLQRKGHHTAIMDADVTGPSIPKAFGITEHAIGTDTVIYPVESKTGIQTMSVNLLLEDSNDPVIWRGPVIAGVVKQFWNETVWGDIDYLFVDMPPGTGDVPLTVFQSLPVDGIVIVTSPQELVQMIVKKAYNMAEMMHVPVLGLIENFSYLKCPDCGREIKLFGESHIEDVAAELTLPVFGKIPLDPAFAEKADEGKFYETENPYLQTAVRALSAMNRIM